MANNNGQIPDEGDQVVPGNVLFNLAVDILSAILPRPDELEMEDDEPIPVDPVLGRLRPLQLVDEDGQGQYLTADCTRYGNVLIKYLEGGFFRRLQDAYNNLGLPPGAIDNIQWAEEQRVRPREILFAQELSHPNIARVLAFISPTGRMADIKALVMEGAAHGVLETCARSDHLTDAVVKSFALQLASALDYCHRRRVMHRDVRPRNIYVHDGGQTVKLGNFGYARVGGPQPLTANRGDELWYKAPEVISRAPLASYSYPVDVYGFALVLWSMSHNGRRPYRDEGVTINSDANFKAYLEAEDGVNRPNIRDDLDVSLKNLMTRCWVLEKGLSHRPPMSEIVAALQQ